jgi:large subunit ribosomal protein L24
MKKIKKGDTVIVLTGKYKGKTGDVAKICKDNRVLVEGINIIKKCVKPNPQRNEVGGIVEKESPIHVSNVAMYDKEASSASKVGFKYLKDSTKVRYYKSNQEIISE